MPFGHAPGDPALLDLSTVPTIRVVDVPGKGRGVIAARAIRAGEVIEQAPVVVVPPQQTRLVDLSVLEHYVYDWEDGAYAVALGAGSIFNHSYAPNAHYRKRAAQLQLEYYALVDIEAGAEVLINYNGDPRDLTPLWFDVVE
jgi:SET domain-containing protein